MGYFDNDEVINTWYEKRRARFTSSSNYKLNGTANAVDTYVEEKVIELTTAIWERPELEEVKSLRHGKIYEYPAYSRYITETKNYSMVYFGSENPQFQEDVTNKDEAGGTPDLANFNTSQKIDYGCEIKCPINPAYHFRRLKWKDQWDIKQNYLLCYTQIQDLIRVTGAFGWDFCSFDERQLSKPKQKVIIEVKPDTKFIDNLEIRLKLAIKAKYKLLSEHMEVELKNRTEYLNFIKS